MENIPCSHVGHVYRNFDRFAVDPSLDNVDVGKALNRNDMRVAEVWLDEYKALFYQARGLAGMDTVFIYFENPTALCPSLPHWAPNGASSACPFALAAKLPHEC